MSSSTHETILQLVAAFPELTPLYEEHRRDYGELLPHVFFGDLTRWILSLYEDSANSPEAVARVREVIDFLEGAFASGDSDLQELISVSFLENLPFPWEPNADIRTMLGPQLSTELAHLG